MKENKKAKSNQLKKRILVVIHIDSFFSALIDVVRLLKDSHNYEPVILFTMFYPNIYRDLQVCEEEHFETFGPNGEPGSALLKRKGATKSHLSSLLKFSNKLSGRISESTKGAIKFWIARRVATQIWKLKKGLRFISRFIHKEKISLVVLGAGITHYNTCLFIKAAHIIHIPSVIVSGWLTDDIELAEVLMYDPIYSMDRFSNWIIGKLYPHWVYEYKGHKMLRLPAGHILAREWLGLVPPNPWLMHSDYADAIAVESEVKYHHGISRGLSSDQLVVTGSIYHDKMAKVFKEAHSQRRKLYQRLNLPDLPMILSALPPDELYRVGGRPECDFQVYEELVKFWVKSMAGIKGYNIVIALHPQLKYEDMQYIEQWGVKIAREPTAGLIPLCDIFVTSMSTTIQWAISCSKPVVNYNIYRNNFPDYVDVKGVINIEEKEDFINILHHITQDHAFRAEIAGLQANCASQWGLLDGKAGKRILKLFDIMIAKYGQ